MAVGVDVGDWAAVDVRVGVGLGVAGAVGVGEEVAVGVLVGVGVGVGLPVGIGDAVPASGQGRQADPSGRPVWWLPASRAARASAQLRLPTWKTISLERSK